MSITTGYISHAFGGDIGSTFYPLGSATPGPATGFLVNGTDCANLFLPISVGAGTSTMSGFTANINGTQKDLSELFATGPGLSITTINDYSSACSYETTSTEKCCPQGGAEGSVSVSASGGYSPYTYDWVVSSSGVFTFSSSTTDTLYFTYGCLGSGTYKANGTVTVTDAKGNQKSGDWSVQMIVTEIT
jgi:hypothetical protein